MTLNRLIRVSLLLIILLAAVIILAMLSGTAKIGFWHGIEGIFLGWRDSYTVLTPLDNTILFSIRLPRIIFAGLVGASLSVAGVVFQALLRNPLADPYVLGISGGSAVGAMIGIIIGAGIFEFGIPCLALLGALLTIFIVFGIAGTGNELQSNTLLLAGVIVNAFFSAVILILISISSNTDLHNAMFWLMGDLSLTSLLGVKLTGIFLIIGFIIIYVEARSLNLIVTGEETAIQLGVNVERTKKILYISASLVTAVAVSYSGIIGFVGLIIPHILRMLFGSDHRLLLPATLLFGASFLIIADTVARTIIAPLELPVGVITALCGAPYFIYLLRRRAL